MELVSSALEPVTALVTYTCTCKVYMYVTELLVATVSVCIAAMQRKPLLCLIVLIALSSVGLTAAMLVSTRRSRRGRAGDPEGVGASMGSNLNILDGRWKLYLSSLLPLSTLAPIYTV